MLKESSLESSVNADSYDTPLKGCINPHIPSKLNGSSKYIRKFHSPRAKNNSSQAFPCDFCGKCFSNKANCERHMSKSCDARYGGKESNIKKEDPVAKNVKKEAVIDKIAGVANNGSELMFLVKWKHIDKPGLVAARDANVKFEKEVVKFYEERLRWHAKQHLSNRG